MTGLERRRDARARSGAIVLVESRCHAAADVDADGARSVRNQPEPGSEFVDRCRSVDAPRTVHRMRKAIVQTAASDDEG